MTHLYKLSIGDVANVDGDYVELSRRLVDETGFSVLKIVPGHCCDCVMEEVDTDFCDNCFLVDERFEKEK